MDPYEELDKELDKELDEELDEELDGEGVPEGFDDFLAWLLPLTEREKVQIADPARLRQLRECCGLLSRLALENDPDAKIEWTMEDGLSLGAGVVRIETTDLVVRDPASFCRAVRSADNFEIYPLIDGKLRFAVLFQGVLREV